MTSLVELLGTNDIVLVFWKTWSIRQGWRVRVDPEGRVIYPMPLSSTVEHHHDSDLELIINDVGVRANEKGKGKERNLLPPTSARVRRYYTLLAHCGPSATAQECCLCTAAATAGNTIALPAVGTTWRDMYGCQSCNLYWHRCCAGWVAESVGCRLDMNSFFRFHCFACDDEQPA